MPHVRETVLEFYISLIYEIYDIYNGMLTGSLKCLQGKIMCVFRTRVTLRIIFVLTRYELTFRL